MVIHTREAEKETFEIMKRFIPKDHKIHVHCYTDSLEFARQLLLEWPTSLFLGFTGVICYPSASKLRKVVEQVPLDRLLLESDGPFLSPLPSQKVCHSALIPIVVDKISKIKNIAKDVIYTQTRINTKHMYSI